MNLDLERPYGRSARCIDALRKTKRVLSKRGRVLLKGRVLNKVFLVRRTGGEPLLKKGGRPHKKAGGVLKNVWRSLRSSTTPQVERRTLRIPGRQLQRVLEGTQLSGPIRDAHPYRAIPFRDSIGEGVSRRFSLIFR